MKTKRLLAIIAMLGLALATFSCKGGNDPKENQKEDLAQLDGVTIHFALPGRDTQTVDTRATAIHDNPEWAIDQLWLYEFDTDGKLVAEPTNIRKSPDFKFSGVEAHYTYKAKWEKDEVRQFYFVVNMDKLEGVEKGCELSTFLAKQHKKEMTSKVEDILYDTNASLYEGGETMTVNNDNQKRIPMTGRAMQGQSHLISVHSNAVISVALKRTVARIDIVNHIRGLEITKMQLFNASKNANVFEQDPLKASDRQTNGVEAFAKLDDSNKMGTREGVSIKKAFYLYETKNTTDAKTQMVAILNDTATPAEPNITYVLITANYGTGANSQNRTFKIPFMLKDDKGKFTKPVDVRRNHIYKIILGSPIDAVPSGQISFKIVEEEWRGHDFEEPMHLVNIKGENTFVHTAYNASTLLLTKESRDVNLTLTSDFTENKGFESLTCLDTATTSSWFKSQKLENNKLSFHVDLNSTGKERSARLTFKCKSTDELFTLTVKQGA